MTTELQWLIKMLTQHKLPSGLKDLFIERIGEVEASLSKPSIRMQQVNPGVHYAPIQAPSMQRAIDEMNNDAPVMPPIAQKRIIGGEVDTGKGTRGPRKF
jgi:hypothetical protein